MQLHDLNDQRAVARFTLDNLPSHKQIALATTNDDGSPWVVCVSQDIDAELNVIWMSADTTQHSKNIAARPEVSACVFSQIEPLGDFGLYIRDTAHEVTDAETVRRLLALRSQKRGKPTPATTEFLAPAPMRLYQLQLREAWVTDNRHKKTSVDIAILKKLAGEHPGYQSTLQA